MDTIDSAGKSENRAKEGIGSLRKMLSELNEKRKKLNERINSLIYENKKLRAEREKANREIQEMKKIRDNLNDEIKGIINRLKEKDGGFTTDRRERWRSIENIERDVDAIEEKIETEPMSFKKEQELMKKLKVLKKKKKVLEEEGAISEEISELNKKARELRKRSDKIHQDVQVSAKKSQEKHIKIVNNSREIDDLKERLNGVEEERLKVRIRLGSADKTRKRENKRGQQPKKDLVSAAKKKVIREKARDAENKIKTGGKLTNQDLIALQGID